MEGHKYKSFLQGTTGAKGVQGEKGEEGPTGPSGKRGLQGVKGEPGAKVLHAVNSLRQTQKKNIHYLAYYLLALRLVEVVIAELHPRAKRARGRNPIAKEMW